MSTSGKLAGKIAIITGSAAGIGRASCQLFAQQGAKVAAVDCDAEGNAKMVEEIRSAGGSAEALTADVASAADVDRVVQQTLSKWQRVDILFNNAGIVPGKKVHTLTEEEWDRAFAINVKSMYLFSRAVIPSFLQQGGGVILNTSSTTALRVAPDRALYTATKGRNSVPHQVHGGRLRRRQHSRELPLPGHHGHTLVAGSLKRRRKY